MPASIEFVICWGFQNETPTGHEDPPTQSMLVVYWVTNMVMLQNNTSNFNFCSPGFFKLCTRVCSMKLSKMVDKLTWNDRLLTSSESLQDVQLQKSTTWALGCVVQVHIEQWLGLANTLHKPSVYPRIPPESFATCKNFTASKPGLLNRQIYMERVPEG